MEDRTNNPGRVLKALISTYLFQMEEEKNEGEKYFNFLNKRTNSRIGNISNAC